MANQAYDDAVKSLKIAIWMIEGAIALAALVVVFTLQNSIRMLSVVGMFKKEVGFEVWVAWPVVALTFGALAWTQFVFFPKARKLFEDPDIPIEGFGKSKQDEWVALVETRLAMNRYSIFILPVCVMIAWFISYSFLNVVLSAVLVALLVGVFLFLRDKARILRAEGALLR